MPKWEVELCGWTSGNGHKCTLRKDHIPLKAWPYHAVTPLPHLGSLQDRAHGGLPLNPTEEEEVESSGQR